MEMIEKTNEKIRITTKMNVSLANAIRRSISEIPTLAVLECDLYKNDSALYDEIISHRLGLVPLKNQKLKSGETIELKLKAKGKAGGTYVLSGEIGDLCVYPEIPIVYLEDGQEIEIVLRAGIGQGKDHAKFKPGLMFYSHLPKIKISKEGEAQAELAELYPKVFSFDNKLKVNDASQFDLEDADLESYPGISIRFDDELVMQIESWGQIPPKEIFLGACKALKDNLSLLSKAIK